jgi:hypothetical protein
MRYYLIDPPGPFSPRKELQDFLAEWENHPDLPHCPEIQALVEDARRDLAWKDEVGIPDDPNPPPYPTDRVD